MYPVRSRVAQQCYFSTTNRKREAFLNTSFAQAEIRKQQGFIVDMDGVVYHGKRVLPGALEFVEWLKANNKKFLFLTNSSERSPRELQEKLQRLGIQVTADHFYTSALATARFLSNQRPNGSAYVIGEPGLFSALYEVGYSMNDTNPDYVVVGETRNYNYNMMETAVHLLRKGARLIGTNCDVVDRMDDSFVPACGSLTKPLEMASGKEAYFIGKPNPLIMRAALTKLGIRREEAVIIGDRMDTDILAGIQSEIRTVLVLSGVTNEFDIARFPYLPDAVLPTVGDILNDKPFSFANYVPRAHSSGGGHASATSAGGGASSSSYSHVNSGTTFRVDKTHHQPVERKTSGGGGSGGGGVRKR